jgi:hypothetical protein
MGQVYQCRWRIYGEIKVFSMFESHMFYVLYTFVTYLLTLPRTTYILKFLIFEIHITIEWGNMFLGSVICYGNI